MTMVTTIHLGSSYRVSRIPPPLRLADLNVPRGLFLWHTSPRATFIPEASHKGITPDARSGRTPWRNTDCCRLSFLEHAAEINVRLRVAPSASSRHKKRRSFLALLFAAPEHGVRAMRKNVSRVLATDEVIVFLDNVRWKSGRYPTTVMSYFCFDIKDTC